MAEIDLNNFSTSELEELAKSIDKELKRREIEKRRNVKAQIRELAASLGMTPEEVLGIESAKKATYKVPKYQNPDNPEQTWTGKGKRPAWLKEALAQGKSLEDLRVSQAG